MTGILMSVTIASFFTFFSGAIAAFGFELNIRKPTFYIPLTVLFVALFALFNWAHLQDVENSEKTRTYLKEAQAVCKAKNKDAEIIFSNGVPKCIVVVQ